MDEQTSAQPPVTPTPSVPVTPMPVEHISSTPPATPGDNKKMMVMGVIIAILLLLLCLGAVIFGPGILERMNGGGTTPTPTPTTSTTPTATDTPTTTATVTTEPTGTTTPTEIDIYFFNQVDFNAGASNVYDVKTRTTTRADVATFAVEQIIAGPTTAEESEGLVSTFGNTDAGDQVEFTSTSTCSGKDFSVTISGRKATVKFCRETFLLGDFSGGIVSEQIAETLKQFSTIDEVRTLDSAGNCFGDLAGFGPEECYR